MLTRFTPSKPLTKRQEAILDFIVEHREEHGISPSIREIGDAFKIGSLRGVTVHLDAMERKGYIVRSNLPRSIVPLKDANGRDVRHKRGERVEVVSIVRTADSGGLAKDETYVTVAFPRLVKPSEATDFAEIRFVKDEEQNGNDD